MSSHIDLIEVLWLLCLQVLSDLHLELGAFTLPEVDADVLVLAGDTALRTPSFEWAKSAAGGRPVVLVPGNHEYYGDSLSQHQGGRALGLRPHVEHGTYHEPVAHARSASTSPDTISRR